MRSSRNAFLTSLLTLVAGVLLVTCARGPRMPARDGAVIEVRRSDRSLTRGQTGYRSTLQLSWFGSGCHYLQLGDLQILTDPFVTNTLSVTRMLSNSDRVAATLKRVPVPDLVLVNHSHHDHMLDGYAAMTLPEWTAAGVPMYGGLSNKNLLAGWGNEDVLQRCRVIADEGGSLAMPPLPSGYSLKVTAYRTKHTPHMKCGFTLLDGVIEEPLSSPPRNILDYKTGEAFNYLMEMRGPESSFTVFYLGGAYDLQKMPGILPPAGTRIDVLIMMAPSAKNVEGYPQDFLARLRPRHVVLSHFNTFVREDPDEQSSVFGIDNVNLPKLSRDIQSTFTGKAVDYPEFEKLHIPAITVMEDGGGARNVLRIY